MQNAVIFSPHIKSQQLHGDNQNYTSMNNPILPLDYVPLLEQNRLTFRKNKLL